MQPYSHYMGLKIIHEQMVEEALERKRFEQEQDTPRQSWLQHVRTLFVRLNASPARKTRAAASPACE